MQNGKSNKIATKRTSQVEPSSGNVFADLGVSNPNLALTKAKLIQRIRELLAERKLTQAQAAELIGLDQPKVSALLRGNVAGYTIDRLFRFLNALGQQIEISIKPTVKNRKAKALRDILVSQ
jgi:predicted XRE-type DNA-binding protein